VVGRRAAGRDRPGLPVWPSVLGQGQGQGYGLEAAAAVLRWGTEERGLDRVGSNVQFLNVASHKILQRLGFTFRSTTGSGRSVAYRALVRLDHAEAAGPAATTRLSSGAACHIQLEAQLFFTLWPPRIGRTHLHPRRRPRGPVRHTTMIPLPGCPQSRTQNGTLLDSGCFACSWSANWRSSVAVLEPDDVVQFRG